MAAKQQTTKRPPGRPQQWRAEEWRDRILEEVAEGFFLEEICRRPDWPSRSVVYRWMEADPALWEAYRARARLMGADAVAERAYREAHEATDAPLGTLRWRAAVWMAAKMNPDRYGDRVNVRRDERPAEELSDGELLAIATGRGAGTAEAADGAA